MLLSAGLPPTWQQGHRAGHAGWHQQRCLAAAPADPDSALSPPALRRAGVAEEGQRGQLSATLLPGHPPRKNPGSQAAQPPARHSKQGLPGCSRGIHSLQKCIPFDALTGECRGISSSAGDAANLAQEWTALPDPAAKLTCPNPVSGSVSELAAPWLQKRGIDGLCWLQQPEGSVTQLSRTRMEKVIHGSLSLLPSMGLPCSSIMPVWKTKRLQCFGDCILISGTSSARKPPGRFLQPWTKYEQPFPHPCHP